MRLHLGCGKKKLEGWINCDLSNSDMDMDIRKLPFPDGSVDEIMAIHVCEHFYVTEIINVMKEWKRVLKDGGKLIVELPCLDKVLWHFSKGSPEQFTLHALYGSPKTHFQSGEPALHKWAWSRQQFKAMLKDAGFSNVVEEEPKFHQLTRDMRWVITK